MIYSKINHGEYVINLDKYKSIGTHWIALNVNSNNVSYLDIFAVKHFQKKLKNF